MTTGAVRAVVFIIAVGVVAAMLAVRWVMRRRAAARNSPPPLFFTLLAQRPLNAPHGNGIANGAPHSNGSAHANRPSSANVTARVVGERARIQPRRTVASPTDEYRDGETIRFYRPSEQALQLLPGHLEVLEGATRDREIRFVRVPGEPPHVLLGRDAGPSPSCVGLGSATVSRRHARLDYADGRWHVMNLSRTNPLVVNDDQLADTDAARVLSDGDRLELGEVVLRFHEH